MNSDATPARQSRLVYVAATMVVLLFAVAVASHVWNACYVWWDGTSVYVGKGWVEFGHGWGWIRRRMFHDTAGLVPRGWKFDWSPPSLAGPVIREARWRISLWLMLLTLTTGALAISDRRSRKQSRWLGELFFGLVVWCVYVILFGWVPPTRWMWSDVYGLAFVVAVTTLGAVAYLQALIRRYKDHARQFRMRHTQCAHCRYNLTGNVSGRCPECGRVIGEAPVATSSRMDEES